MFIEWIQTQKMGLFVGISTCKGDKVLISSKDIISSFSVYY